MGRKNRRMKRVLTLWIKDIGYSYLNPPPHQKYKWVYLWHCVYICTYVCNVSGSVVILSWPKVVSSALPHQFLFLCCGPCPKAKTRWCILSLGLFSIFCTCPYLSCPPPLTLVISHSFLWWPYLLPLSPGTVRIGLLRWGLGKKE